MLPLIMVACFDVDVVEETSLETIETIASSNVKASLVRPLPTQMVGVAVRKPSSTVRKYSQLAGLVVLPLVSRMKLSPSAGWWTSVFSRNCLHVMFLGCFALFLAVGVSLTSLGFVNYGSKDEIIPTLRVLGLMALVLCIVFLFCACAILSDCVVSAYRGKPACGDCSYHAIRKVAAANQRCMSVGSATLQYKRCNANKLIVPNARHSIAGNMSYNQSSCDVLSSTNDVSPRHCSVPCPLCEQERAERRRELTTPIQADSPSIIVNKFTVTKNVLEQYSNELTKGDTSAPCVTRNAGSCCSSLTTSAVIMSPICSTTTSPPVFRIVKFIDENTLKADASEGLAGDESDPLDDSIFDS